MRFIVLVFMMLFVSTSAVAADDWGLDSTSLSILKENRKDISVLGMLKFCGRTDLEGPFSIKIAASIADKLLHDPNLVTRSAGLLQVADQQAIGVALGLMLANVSGTEKQNLCKLAISMSDTTSDTSRAEP